MKTAYLLVPVVFCLCLPVHAAQAAGLSMPQWMKFGGKEKVTSKPAIHRKYASKQMLDGKPVKRDVKKDSGMLSGVTAGPKKLLASTKKVFTTSKKKTKASSATGRQAMHHRKADTPKEKPSFFKNWFKSEEPEPPKSVEEWMKLPRNDL